MGMSAGGGGGRKAPLAEINVTPLVDVMLVLLIIFMVAAPMLSIGVEVELPEADAPKLEAEEDSLLLAIDAEQNIFLISTEKEQIAFEDLVTALAKNEKVQEKNEIFVHADETVPYGVVAKVLAAVRKAGIEKMGLVTDPPSEMGSD